MATSIDDLQIQISASATKANTEIDKLISRLGKLSTSLSSINGSSITGLANGVQKLGTAMQSMSNVRTADFSRLAKNITKLGSLDTSALNRTASSMSQITRSFNQLGSVSSNAVQVGELAKSISKLGNKGVQNAITNIPQLAAAMKQLMATLSTAPTVSSNIIQMTNALANLASQGRIDNLVRRLGTLNTSLSRVNGRSFNNLGNSVRNISNGFHNLSSVFSRANSSIKKTTDLTTSLAQAFGKFYASYFLVIRGTKKLWSAIESTADYIEAYNYFDVAMGKVGADWEHQWEKYSERAGVSSAEEYADSFADRLNTELRKLSGVNLEIDAQGDGLLTTNSMKNLGLNIQEVTQYASQLASVTNSVGQTGETTLAIADSFTKLAGDISSLFNVSYSTVATNLQSGLIGQSRALYKYGIDITNATLQTKAYELGLEKAVSEMTQMEKMQLRVLAILEQSKISWGDLSNTLQSPSNQIRLLKNNFAELAMVIGQLFMPILSKVLPIINGVVIALKRLAVMIANFFGIKLNLSEYGQGYSDLEEDIGGVSDGFDEATKSVKKFKGQLQKFDELNNLSTGSNSGKGEGIGSTIDLTDEILKATDEYNKAWQKAFDEMENKAEKFADKIMKLFKKIASYVKAGDFKELGRWLSDSLTDALDSINWNKIQKVAKKVAKNLAEFLNGFITPKLFGAVGRTIAEYYNTIVYSLLSFGETFDFTNLGNSLAEAVNEFFRTFDWAALGKTINTFFQGLLDFMITFIKKVRWTRIGNSIGTAIANVDWAKALKKIGKLIWEAINAAIKTYVSLFSAAPIETAIITAAALLKFTGLGSVISKAITAALATPGGILATVAIGISAVLIGIDNAYIESQLVKFEEEQIAKYGDKLQNIYDNAASAAEQISAFNERTREQLESKDANISYLEAVADKYDVLSQKTNLSSTEKAQLKTITDELIDTFPSLQEYYNAETGLLDTTTESIKAMIAEKEKEIKLNAISEAWTESLKQRIEKERELQTNVENLEKAESELDAIMKIVNDEIAKHGGNANLAPYQKQVAEAMSSVEDLTATVQTNKDTLNSIDDQVDYYDKLWADVAASSTKFEESSKAIGSGIANGIANGINENQESTKIAAEGIVGDINAKMQEYDKAIFGVTGSDIVANVANGISENQQTAEVAAEGLISRVDTKMKEYNMALFGEMGEDIVAGVTEPIENADTTETSKGFFDKLVDSIKSIFGIHSPAANMMPLGEYILLGVVEGFNDKVSEFNTAISNWFTNSVTPWFTVEKWTGILTNVKTAFVNIFNDIKNKITEIISGLWTDISDFFANIGKGVDDAKSNLGEGLGQLPGLGNIAGAVTGKSIPAYATGGFPEDGLFFANRSELVGSFSNGKTAVANNEQITEGIKWAAYEGMKMALSEQQGGNVNVNVSLEGDANRLFKVVKEENYNQFKRTGRNALAF